MGGLYIIGVPHHEDRVYSARRLHALYEELQPDLVLSEWSEKDREIHREYFEDVKKVLLHHSTTPQIIKSIENLEELISCDMKVNEHYTKKNRVEHHFIDLPRPGYQDFLNAHLVGLSQHLNGFEEEGVRGHISTYLGEMNKTIPYQDLKTFADKRMEKEGTLEGEAFLLYHATRPTPGRKYFGQRRLGRRDSFMANRIKELYHPDKTIVFPVGLLHALESKLGITAYSKIQDLNPERKILI